MEPHIKTQLQIFPKQNVAFKKNKKNSISIQDENTNVKSPRVKWYI